MLCINNKCTDVFFNLATEEYLLKKYNENIFMIWQNQPSVVIGKHQNIWDEVNLDFIEQNQVNVVRRYTGGGTVYHDLGNVNLSFIESGVNVDFSKFTQTMIDALAVLGIKAQADNRKALNIDGLKISGSAQSVYKNRVLYHATLLFNSDLETLNQTISVSPNSRKKTNAKKIFVKSVRSIVTNISEHLDQTLSVDQFKDKLIEFFLKNKDSKLHTLSDADKAEIEKLKQEKYIQKEWTYNPL